MLKSLKKTCHTKHECSCLVEESSEEPSLNQLEAQEETWDGQERTQKENQVCVRIHQNIQMSEKIFIKLFSDSY